MYPSVQTLRPGMAAACALLATSALANGEPPMAPQPLAPAPMPMRVLDPQAQGTKEIEVSGNFFKAEGSDVGTIGADVAFGWYVLPKLDLGIRQTFNYSFIDDGDDQWWASTVPFLEYSFLDGPFRPFLGLFAGGVYNDDQLLGTAGPSVGFRWYLNESTALVTRYRFEWFFEDLDFETRSGIVDDTDIEDDDSTRGNHVVTLGLSFSWR